MLTPYGGRHDADAAAAAHGQGMALSPCAERTLRLWKEDVVKDLCQRPRAGIRKRRQGQAGLPARFTACCLVAAHRPRVKRHARDVGRAETGRELSARRPDGIGPAMARLAVGGLIAPLEQMYEEILQMRGHCPLLARPHAVVVSNVTPSGKKSRSRTCVAVNGQVAGKTSPAIWACAFPRASGYSAAKTVLR